jgi:hypothetical protein
MTVFCIHLEIDQPQTAASGVICKGRRHGPSFTYKITPGGLLSSSQPGGAAVLGQPSIAFSLTGSNVTWLVKYASLHCRKWDQGISLSKERHEPFSSLDFASNYAFSFGLKKN